MKTTDKKKPKYVVQNIPNFMKNDEIALAI